ncbi:putative protein phosphatase 2C 6 [Symbiodinium microadriaticum]|uniref:PPM-type phosphatase domain-containing protein n=1 Tax=Symbiodinium microadriaticum TaxID=2951 RepID=A0A1Q9DRJ0_SYMMI|nr:putative protein phosphatase 2C 6 [Symbiodinium microadriaticum]
MGQPDRKSFWSLSWPWAPFLMACVSRAVFSLYIVLLIEDKVIGLAPVLLRSICFYAVAAVFATWILRQVSSLCNVQPTPDLRVYVESGSFRDNSVSWVSAEMRGWRENMEDAHVAADFCKDAFEDALLFAVLDGHGGSDVSTLASKLLTREMEACRRRLHTSKMSQAEVLAEVVRQSLPRLDEKLRSGSWGIGWLFPGVLHPFAACGSTCVTAAVDLVGREVIVGNVGDSRALLIRDGKAIALSEDHKPENPIERNRIRAAGGQVIKIGPCHRVDGNLNLSRAFGDFNYKSTAHLPAEKQKVIAYPDVTRTAFRGWPQELLVLACDGLFERCSNQDIANLIWPRLKNAMPLEQIATEVLHACCARSSRGRPIEEGTDNETIILIRLPDSRAPEEAGAANSADGPSHEAQEPPLLAPGQRVRVQNLASEAGQKLNGLEGTVEGAGSCDGRYSVRLPGATSTKSLKAENLTPIQAC